MLVGIVHMVLKVPLSMVPLILPIVELSMVLCMLLAYVIKPQVKARKLIGKKLIERNLLQSRGAGPIGGVTNYKECMRWNDIPISGSWAFSS